MKKNISPLTFTVHTVNSSYWESHSSENLVANQDSLTWLMIFTILMTWLLDNVLALWWELRSWYKGVFNQTRKDDFNTFYYMASSLSGQDEQNPALWLATQAGKMAPSSSRTAKRKSLGLALSCFESDFCLFFLSQMDEKFTSFSRLGW